MAHQRKKYADILWSMNDNDVRQQAVNILCTLLDRCTINLASTLTRISRPTLYRWLDPELPLEAVDYKTACYFILLAETHPKLLMLFDRPPMKYTRLAHRLINEEGNNEQATTD